MTDQACPAILFAVDRECAPFRRLFATQRRCREAPGRAWICTRGERTFLIMEVGIGPARTRQALDWLRSLPQEIPFLIMAGFAGALSPELTVGDVLLASDIVDLDGSCWPATWPGRQDSVTVGRLITSPRLIGDPAEKRRLHAGHRALAVDMEAATVAEFCRQHNIPFGCVRSISDNVDTPLSPHLVSLLGHGQVSIIRLVTTLLRHPSVVVSLARLARDTRQAAQKLAGALAKLLSLVRD